MILCDGELFWMVKAIAFGKNGVRPARVAFDLFLKTARFEPAPGPGR